MRKLWVSCEKFTILIEVDKFGIIREAAPIVDKFVGQSVKRLFSWIEYKWPNSFRHEEIDNTMKRVSSPAKTMRRRQLACSRCGDKIKKGRRDLGYKTCLKCGEEAAKKEITAKAERTAPAYNKGAYQFLTPGTNIREIARKL